MTRLKLGSRRQLTSPIRRSLENRRVRKAHPGAQYTVGYVMRDGNMHDVSEHGNNLLAALRACEREKREYASKYADPRQARFWIHWFVFDADDPERGYFDELEAA